MTRVVVPDAAALAICRALDLDPLRVRLLRLEFQAGAPPRVDVEMWPDDRVSDEVALVLRSYRLVGVVA